MNTDGNNNSHGMPCHGKERWDKRSAFINVEVEKFDTHEGRGPTIREVSMNAFLDSTLKGRKMQMSISISVDAARYHRPITISMVMPIQRKA